MASKHIKFHTLEFHLQKNAIKLTVAAENETKILEGVLGLTLSRTLEFADQTNKDVLEAKCVGIGTLTVNHREISSAEHRYDFKWSASNLKEFQDAFFISGAHWYGGAHIRKYSWPMEKMDFKPMPFVSGDSFKDGTFSGVQERYFLSSKGAAIFVDPSVPLFLGLNNKGDQRLVLMSKYNWPYTNHDGRQLALSYTIFQSKDVRSVHDLVTKEMISRPVNIPDEMLFRHPIWSTWAVYRKNINQKIILQFADEIRDHGFKAAQLEIDDDWTPTYGDMDFDKKKFPKPAEMVEELKRKGFSVTLWIHPFASPHSYAAGHNHWVTSYTKGYTTWWNGVGKSLDVTNPAAVAWFKGCLQVLKDKYGIKSFKFDAGEVYWLPSGYTTHAKLETPNEYSRLYAEMCYSIDSDLRAQEIRVGVQTQHLPVFVRMMDKESCWSCDNGLKTLIPHALTYGVIGYPFILPDMIGGNAYKGQPDRELYIRWIEANALLPCMQFSLPPWTYDDGVVKIAQKMLSLHEKFADRMISLAKESTVTGAPIVRPLWWIAPDDEIAQTIDSEFLLGDDILVAPVLEPGQISRSIYLPGGTWKCELTGNTLEGGRWHENYPAKLEDLPYFTRVSNADATADESK